MSSDSPRPQGATRVANPASKSPDQSGRRGRGEGATSRSAEPAPPPVETHGGKSPDNNGSLTSSHTPSSSSVPKRRKRKTGKTGKIGNAAASDAVEPVNGSLKSKPEDAADTKLVPPVGPGDAAPRDVEADRELLQRCASGDSGAWTLFDERFGRFIEWMVRRAARRLGFGAAGLQEADVDDLRASLQVALLDREGRVLRRYDGRAAVTTYLAVVGMRHLNREIRRRLGTAAKPRATTPLDGLVADSLADARDDARPDRPLEQTEQASAVASALATIPERDALLLRLAYEEEVSYDQIAATLGVAANSVGPLLQRARGRFTKAFGGG